MVRSISERLADVNSSYQLMKGCLHEWDSVDNLIDEELRKIQWLHETGGMSSQIVDEFERKRDELRIDVYKEIHDNIDNLEKGVIALTTTAVVGLAAGGGAIVLKTAAGAALGAAILSFLRGAASTVVEALKPIVPRVSSKLPEISRENIRKIPEFISTKWQWVRERWYRRWAPVPIGIGFGLTRTAWVASKQKASRDALKISAPVEIMKRVQKGLPISWEEGIGLVQEYHHDSEFMEHLLPRLYQQGLTPESALVLTHTLLEIFSLSPFLEPETKNHYGTILEREFHRSLAQFGQLVLELDLTGAKDSSEGIYDLTDDKGKKIQIRGFIAKAGIDGLIAAMIKEKRALLQMMGIHEAWVARQVSPEQFSVIRMRKDYVKESAYPKTWGEMQVKLNGLEQYMSKVKQSFASMGQDFQEKNLNIWALYGLNAAPVKIFMAPSLGQFIGWFSGSLFVRGPGWSVMFKSIPFGVAGGFVSASYTAEKLAQLRQPIKQCLPSYGALCEQI